LEGQYVHPSGMPTGKPFEARLSALGEPGGKVRIPTVTSCHLVGYLQPYAHAMRHVLECDPTLSAGLGAANQSYEFVKRFRGQMLSDECMLHADFADATQWIHPIIGKETMESFLEGLSGGTPITDYVRSVPHLLLSPLCI
jgi:hypothetical protein